MSWTGLVDHVGYLGLALVVFVEGFGVPAPGETAIIAGATLAGRGHLNIVLVGVVAVLAAITGDSVGYLIGRTGGRALVLRYGRYVRLTHERFERMEGFMRRRGPIVVAVARFIEGLRQLNGVVAGASGMPWPRFVLFNAIGAVLWVGTWATAGYLAGDHLKAIEATISRYQWYAIGLAVLAVIAYAFWHVRRIRRHRALAAANSNDPPG
jgi:membrane protein DedA with SNARE-associated domain